MSMKAVLKGGQHGHEHFEFEDYPTRIFVQTKERSGGMYSRGRNEASIYQDTRGFEDGCRVYAYVRSVRRKLNGLVKTEHD